ncbi:MAG: sigma-70 family RNA polymerase sigma factor [Synergistaceae bacterium]|nr:sigma-70 family RNA polymerase sigma factor [Synergistaceae bacterium]
MRDYPERKRECGLIAQAIEAMCHSRIQEARRDSEPESSEPERVTEALEADRNYQRLTKFSAFVKEAVSALSAEEQLITQYAFWENLTSRKIAEELHMDERTVRRHKNRARRKLIRLFLHPDIAGMLDVNLSYPGQGEM